MFNFNSFKVRFLKESYDGALCCSGFWVSHNWDPLYRGNALNLSLLGLGMRNRILSLDLVFADCVSRSR